MRRLGTALRIEEVAQAAHAVIVQEDRLAPEIEQQRQCDPPLFPANARIDDGHLVVERIAWRVFDRIERRRPLREHLGIVAGEDALHRTNG